MKSSSTIVTVTWLVICGPLVGCASIISGRSANVAIDSYPSNAFVTVRDNNGRAVASTTTPGVVSLKRNRKWLLPAKYTATIEAPGYAPADVAIGSTLNPWILGNIVLGGIPGLIVDNATGAAWQPKQSEIHRELAPMGMPPQGPMISIDEPPNPAPAIAPPPVPQLVVERPESPVKVGGAVSVGAAIAR